MNAKRKEDSFRRFSFKGKGITFICIRVKLTYISNGHFSDKVRYLGVPDTPSSPNTRGGRLEPLRIHVLNATFMILMHKFTNFLAL